MFGSNIIFLGFLSGLGCQSILYLLLFIRWISILDINNLNFTYCIRKMPLRLRKKVIFKIKKYILKKLFTCPQFHFYQNILQTFAIPLLFMIVISIF